MCEHERHATIVVRALEQLPEPAGHTVRQVAVAAERTEHRVRVALVVLDDALTEPRRVLPVHAGDLLIGEHAAAPDERVVVQRAERAHDAVHHHVDERRIIQLALVDGVGIARLEQLIHGGAGAHGEGDADDQRESRARRLSERLHRVLFLSVHGVPRPQKLKFSDMSSLRCIGIEP